jgi:hypothetical protein
MLCWLTTIKVVYDMRDSYFEEKIVKIQVRMVKFTLTINKLNVKYISK